VADEFSERVIRFIRLRPELRPVEIYDRDGSQLDPDWLGITHVVDHPNDLVSPTESFNLSYFRDDGELLTWQQFETLTIALDQAHAIVRVGQDEWQSCDVETHAEGRLPWAAIHASLEDSH
jgi:hypothetical protein